MNIIIQRIRDHPTTQKQFEDQNNIAITFEEEDNQGYSGYNKDVQGSE